MLVCMFAKCPWLTTPAFLPSADQSLTSNIFLAHSDSYAESAPVNTRLLDVNTRLQDRAKRDEYITEFTRGIGDKAVQLPPSVCNSVIHDPFFFSAPSCTPLSWLKFLSFYIVFVWTLLGEDSAYSQDIIGDETDGLDTLILRTTIFFGSSGPWAHSLLLPVWTFANFPSLNFLSYLRGHVFSLLLNSLLRTCCLKRGDHLGPISQVRRNHVRAHMRIDAAVFKSDSHIIRLERFSRSRIDQTSSTKKQFPFASVKKQKGEI